MSDTMRRIIAAGTLFAVNSAATGKALAEKGNPIAPVAHAQVCKLALHDGMGKAIAALDVAKNAVLIVALKDMQNALVGKGRITAATAEVVRNSVKEKGFTTVIGAECRDYAYGELIGLTKPAPVMVQRTYQPGQLSR